MLFSFLWKSILFFYRFIFYWRITAIQYYADFCHASAWISHGYTYVPCLLNIPHTSTPSHPSRLSENTEFELHHYQIPTGYLFAEDILKWIVFLYFNWQMCDGEEYSSVHTVLRNEHWNTLMLLLFWHYQDANSFIQHCLYTMSANVSTV